ncbi:MAG: hypothetical protein KBG17_01265, partial [Paludibacteraceae bacterium]|nr:hypothetical protein [Paludibacteraceae bacterium]
MKKKFLNYLVISSVMVSGSIFFTACDDKSDPDPEPTPTSNEVIINSDITGTRNLVNDSIYILEGQVNVSGIINIEKGTIIKGDKLTKGCLVVLRGGKINAIGTSGEPIVFTSRMEPGLRNAGDWGGIIIVGNAPVNQSNPSG